MFGLPRRIHVDNGSEFRGSAMLRGCEDLGIDVSFREVGAPQTGGHIERMIGTLMRHCHLLPGTSFSSVAELGDYDSERHTALTLPELERFLVTAIVRYHTALHRGIGTTPMEKWREKWTVDGQIVTPPVLGDEQEIRLCFLPRADRVIGRQGIAVHCLNYWNDELRAYVGNGESYSIHYDPRDVRMVWVRLHDGRFVEATCTTKDMPKLFVSEWNALLALARERAREAEAKTRDIHRSALKAGEDLVTGAVQETQKAKRTRGANHERKSRRAAREAMARANVERNEAGRAGPPLQGVLAFESPTPRKRFGVDGYGKVG